MTPQALKSNQSAAGQSGVLRRVAWLAPLLTAAIGAAALAPIGYVCSGTQGLIAVAVAIGICLAGALSGEFCSFALRGLGPANAMLAGMMPRMGVPLSLVMMIYLMPSALCDAGLVFYVLTLYPLVLAAETWASVQRIGQAYGAELLKSSRS